ncbi:MAG: biotin--[acetyl-CoA-carboxylase] ligase [Ilumatobacter sp.]|uniref:biotin--[acetyl-CoA-carboxylase] ligase n=1 Tax=Ilumatobacter sp. TaxID=1967498 RepID=UPI00262262BD|nr:biotin--[acetyl-CoA-carboxylase] ligase [Ilumatobacter sp.]MDJ0768085.1 biotin--[acetyl-CoA-carboxylase] ligase [Ilumatobacter sp.]
MDPTNHPRPDGPAPNGPGRTWPPGWTVRHVAETGSTNADLVAASAAGEAGDRTVLVTDHQTAGRGRFDRRWDAPPGTNLLVSLLFSDVAGDAHDLTRRVGVAAVAASERCAGVAADLKWPNDVLVGDRKLAGILAQRCPDGGVVVGLGLNVGWAPDDAAKLGSGIGPLDVLAALLVAFDDLPDDVYPRYRELLGTIGRRVRVVRPDGELVGRALDVDRDGRLRVLDECAVTHSIDVGDVVHLRSAG